MTTQSDTVQKKIGLDTPIVSLFKLNWELVLYGTILVAAIFTRFYNLGARVMSHDESLHTLYSWNLYAGKGYQHDPLMHGPFLFHLTALIYFLFGDNDFTARMLTASMGTILVILPYWFRPWLGRIGALSAAGMILISPGLLYYSRYIRHDILISVWTVLMVMAFFQFMRTRASRWLYIGAIAVALMLSTKEISYIHGFIGITFILLFYLWENITAARRQMVNYGLIGLLAVLVAAIAYLSLNAADISGEEGSNIWTYIGIMVLIAGLLTALLVIQLGADRVNRPVTLFMLSLPGRLMDVGKAALAGLIIWLLLHTTFFSNIGGIYSGSIGEITYWLAQQEVQRGGQPWYYYLFLTPMYEFLPISIGLIGGLVYIIRRKFPAHADPKPIEPGKAVPGTNDTTIYWASDGGTFAAFAIYWTIVAVVIYSWAGEKMPWLTVHLTLPFIFVAAHVIQTALEKFSWSEAWHRNGAILAVALVLIPAALVAILTAEPFRSQSLQSINETTQFIAGIAVLLGLLATIFIVGRKMGKALAARVAFVTVTIFLSLLTVRFAWLLNFVNYDYVNEMLVYAHASPDVKLALSQIDEISRRTVGDKMIRVAYDNDSTWPLEWYMREYPNRVYYGENPTRESLDAPIVIVGSANEAKVKPYLGDQYTGFNYRLVWWPIEDYKDQTLKKLWQTYVSGSTPENIALNPEESRQISRREVRENWKKLFNILFYRHFEDYDLNEWPFVHRFNLYIRNDVLNDVWDYQSGPVRFSAGQTAASLDPYLNRRADLTAQAVWGSIGQGDGQFSMPRNLAIAPDGTIYVADSGNHRIQVFDPEGNYLFQWGSEGSLQSQFNEPWGIAVAPNGNVYVADTWNHRVQIFSPTGQFVGMFGSFANAQVDAQAEPGKFWGPRDIAIDSGGLLYVTDTGNKRIQKFSADGQHLQTFGGGGIVAGAFEEPTGIAIDQDGNFYVADTWNRRVQKFDPQFNPILQWDVAGWESESVVNKPYLAVDQRNRVFVSDPEGYRIIVYEGDTGDVAFTWGQFGQDLASFGLPIGVKVNAEGSVLVMDSDNNRVMEFQSPSLLPYE